MYRCRLLLSISIVALLLAFVGAVQAKNLLQNPQFSDYGGSFNGWDSVTGESGVWEWSNGGPELSWATINTSDDVTVGFSCDSSAEFGNIDAYGWGGWAGGSGAFQGVLMEGGIAVSMSAYAKGETTNGASGIDMVFFDVIPSETVQDPPNIGRVDLQFAAFGPANAQGWRYGLLTAVTPMGVTPTPGGDGNTHYMKFEVNNNGDPHTILFDNIVGIPEPATIALLSLGGLALIRRKR
jgi:hypothetical protein